MTPGTRPICHRLAIADAAPEIVRDYLGDPDPYYVDKHSITSERWDTLLRARDAVAGPDAGYGEVRDSSGWRELEVGTPARALSVDPAAIRWADPRGYRRIGGASHERLFCPGDSGDDVRTGDITREESDTLRISGWRRD